MTARPKKLVLILGILARGDCLHGGRPGIFELQPCTGGRKTSFSSIDRGQNLSEISRRLQSQGFITVRSPSGCAGQAAWNPGQLQGRCTTGFRRDAGTFAIHDLLVQGSQKLGKVTIPEGWTAGKIARHLEALGLCPAADFLSAVRSPVLLSQFGITGKTMEGYLFPDTYFVPVPFTGAAMVELMAKTFFDTVGRIEPDWRDLDHESMRGTIIMASIVEREYRADDEAPLIASVFYNRLKKNIGLESCATLEYIITEIQQKAHPEYITLEDEKIDSPYNTYKWAGLPPGPISNPGKIALEAAFHPAKSGYLYFVLRDQQAGRHFFSRDLSEHNQAKYLYLKKS